MYRTGLILDNSRLLAKLTSLHVWGEITQFEIEAVCSSLPSLLRLLDQKPFDLLIIEDKLVSQDNFRPLKKILSHKGCRHAALCSDDQDMLSAGILPFSGVEDHFTLPFREDHILAFFDRIRAEDEDVQISTVELSDRLFSMFMAQDDDIDSYLDYLYQRRIIGEVTDAAIKKLFDQHEWLDLYANEEDYLFESLMDYMVYKNRFLGLLGCYHQLLPDHSPNLSEILLYILYNPENDLRQKTLSETFHINQSYLSMVFPAQVDVRFVDYISYVKLMRAAWFLKNTDMKVIEIARRMNYKDVAYFSRQFKKTFHVTPSQYRLPDDYSFVI